MRININKPTKGIYFGCVLYREHTNEAFLVVERDGLCEDFPIAIINLTTNKVYDEYDSMISVESEFSDSIIYQPNEVYMGVGKNYGEY